MQASVLFDDGTAVDAYDFSVREGLLDGAHSLCVEVGLGVGGHEYGTVHHKIVGIGGRQAVAMLIIRCTLFIVIDGSGERQAQ